jgi:hypothetical protein
MASGGRAVFNIEQDAGDRRGHTSLEARKAEAAARGESNALEGLPIVQK